MNKIEFYEEIKKSGHSIDNFDKIKEEFCHYQEIITEILNEFHKICEKNGIFYELAFGSLLGAIRDDGQIPWDYDIDVFALHEQRKKIIEILNQELNDKFYFICKENNDSCRNMLLRLAPKGYNSDYLHVDVFFLTGISEEKPDEDRAAIYNYSNIYFYKKVKLNFKEIPFRTNIKIIIYKFLYLFKGKEKIWNEYNNLCNTVNIHKSNYCVSAEFTAIDNKFSTNIILDTILINVNGYEYRVPKNYSNILNNIYGDYMKIPPLESRINEMLNSYYRIKKFGKL